MSCVLPVSCMIFSLEAIVSSWCLVKIAQKKKKKMKGGGRTRSFKACEPLKRWADRRNWSVIYILEAGI